MEPKPVRDDPGAQSTIREAVGRRIPEGLMRRLHEANGRADALRKQLEATIGDSEFDHAARTDGVAETLRQAEAEIEKINDEVRAATPPQATGEAAG